MDRQCVSILQHFGKTLLLSLLTTMLTVMFKDMMTEVAKLAPVMN